MSTRQSCLPRICLLSLFVIASAFTMVSSVPVHAATPVLRVQMIISQAQINLLQREVIPDFERENKVKVEITPVTWSDRMEKILAGTAAGVVPDVFMNGAEQIYELVRANLLTDLTDRLNAWPDKKDFVPGAFGSSTWGGRNYGVPLLAAPRMWWYYYDLFEEAGLDPKRPPDTWSDLLTAVRKLTRTQGKEIVQQGYSIERLSLNDPFANIQEFVPYLWQAGGELINEDLQVGFTSNAAIQALEFMLDLREASLPAGYTLRPLNNVAFYAKRAAILLFSSVVGFEVARNDPKQLDRLGVFVPRNKERVTPIFADWLGIHRQSQQKEAAWNFIKAVTAPDILVKFLELPSPRYSTIATVVQRNPSLRFSYQVMEFSRRYPIFPESDRLTRIWGAAYQKVVYGQQSPEAAMASAADQWNDVLKAYR
ncbi:MAG: ABC transporter substrate-binding protein [Bacteroidota bacterium]